MNPKSYHDSLREIQINKKEYELKAGKQDAIVLAIFKSFPDLYIAPSVLHDALIIEKLIPSGTPLTSIRRALTNLTDRKLLIKTDKKQKGNYGRAETCWRYNNGE